MQVGTFILLPLKVTQESLIVWLLKGQRAKHNGAYALIIKKMTNHTFSINILPAGFLEM